jgi:uncharacterized protein (TIGR02284 family)
MSRMPASVANALGNNHHRKDFNMLDQSKTIATLNTLIATTIDSIEGYAESAKDAESTQFASIFNERAAERREALTKLQAEVGRLGGTPEASGSTLGSAHHMFVNLKSAITGQDDQAIINEVERGEDYIKGKYEEALRNVDLPPQTRAVIEEAYSSVKRGHDQISGLKHSLQAAR